MELRNMKKRRAGRKHQEGSPLLPLTKKEISVMLKALSFFENALKHDQHEKTIIFMLRRKLHDELMRGGDRIGALQR